MNVPQTAFSLLCNATSVSAFRREAHEDLRVSFERFAVTDGVVQDACSRMEDAAYELRTHTIDPHGREVDPPTRRKYQGALRELREGTQDLFAQLQAEFAWFIAGYASLSRDSRYVAARRFSLATWSANGLLLDLVYQCFYVPEFAAELVASWGNLASDRRVAGIADVAGLNALLHVATAFSARSGLPAADASACAAALGSALAAEYVDIGWIHCW
jgi:hypothetical protein